MSSPRVLIYLLRRDLRLTDNPIFTEVSKIFQQSQHPITHFLPIYIFAAQQIEVSGFLSSDCERSPFPEARSNVAGFWRCGHHRAKFLAESVWDLKNSLNNAGSGLEIQVGLAGQVIQELLNGFKKQSAEVVAIWMTGEEGVEEKREERDVKEAAERAGTEFKLWTDEKYYIDDRDIPFQNPRLLPDIFTTYRKQVEPLREAPRRVLPPPSRLPPLPPSIPSQPHPFTIPTTVEDTIAKLHKPLDPNLGLSNPPTWPTNAKSAHPFHGGETAGHERIRHLISSGSMTTYKDTRNGMLGLDFSTKLSAWLALGCVTARQIHEYLLKFEDGKTDLGKGVHGYGKGENKGTAAVRFELLWRDYFRLNTRKFGPRLFRIEGPKNDTLTSWKYPQKDKETQRRVTRFLEGTTGTGLIDASMKELFLTGYTSNRSRQNVASFLAKHLAINWTIGAEWYESVLVDYDLSSNWNNWGYVAGVGNDPREARVFNPVKQAHDYDPHGEYVKTWVPELSPLDDPQIIFQPWKMTDEKKAELKLKGIEWIENPLKKIEFHVGRSAGRGGGRGGGKGGKAGGSRGWFGGGGGFHGRGRGEKSRGQSRKGRVDRHLAKMMPGPTQFHAVPFEERAPDGKGGKLPFALEYPSGHPDAPRVQKRLVEEKGSFGKSTRRKTASRTRSATPAKKEINPTLDGFVSALNYDTQRAVESQQQATASTRTQNDGNVASHHRPSHNKEPTQIIVFGFSPSTQWAAIDTYEKVSHGMICEDYARRPPAELRRYPYTLSSPSVHRRKLTDPEREMARHYAGGESWVRLTCDSAEAADRAVEMSPQQIYGHWVHAELYNGTRPDIDEPIPVRGEDQQRESFGSPKPPRRPSQTLSAAFSQHAINQQRPSSTLPRSFGMPATTQASSQRPNDVASSSSSTASSATATGPDYPNLRNRHPPQAEEKISPPAAQSLTTTSVAGSNPAMMRYFKDRPRTVLRPATEAFLPQPTWTDRQVQWLRSWGVIPGDFIGNGPPLTENGDFDWSRASWYWCVWNWMDTYLNTNFCNLKDE